MAEGVQEKTTFRSQLEGFKVGEQRTFTFDDVRAMRSAKVNAHAYSQEIGQRFFISQNPTTCALSITRMA